MTGDDVVSLKERLEEIMRAQGWSQADLVRESGESRSVVSQWLGKGSKTIHSIGKMETAERLEERSGFRALWIAKGKGPKSFPGTPDRAAAVVSRAPLRLEAVLQELARLMAGHETEIREAAAPMIAAIVRTPERLRTLSPRIEALLQVEPDHESVLGEGESLGPGFGSGGDSALGALDELTPTTTGKREQKR